MKSGKRDNDRPKKSSKSDKGRKKKSSKSDKEPQKKSSPRNKKTQQKKTNPKENRHELKLSKQDREKFQRVTRLEQMQKMDPVKFEWFVGWVYEQRGYTVHTTVTSGDEGIDLELWRSGKKVVVQCKRYKGTVGQPTVRDMYGTMHHSGARAAHVVTTGKFSRQAETWAAGKPIILIDGNDLVALLNKMRRKGTSTTGIVDIADLTEQTEAVKTKDPQAEGFNLTQFLIVLGFISFFITTLWWLLS